MEKGYSRHSGRVLETKYAAIEEDLNKTKILCFCPTIIADQQKKGNMVIWDPEQSNIFENTSLRNPEPSWSKNTSVRDHEPFLICKKKKSERDPKSSLTCENIYERDHPRFVITYL